MSPPRGSDPVTWVREHGVVLQSAKGPLPNLAEHVAGEPIKGSWWGHPRGHQIYAVLEQVDDSPEVVATKLLNDRITLIHRRLWPALVRVADRFPADRLAQVGEEHTETGAHRKVVVPYPEWVPPEVMAEAASLTEDEALAQLPDCLRG